MQLRIFEPASGQVRTVTVDALSDVDVDALVAQKGWTLLAVEKGRREGAFRDADVAPLAADLARLLRAGLTLPEALETQTFRAGSNLRGVYQRIHATVSQGKPLSDALTAHGGFSPVLIAAIRSSERSARVAEALEEYARYDLAIRALRRKAVSAAVYPAAVTSFGLLVCVFLIGYVVPRFAGIFADTAANVSDATRVLLAIGQFINAQPLLSAGGAIVGVIAIAGTLLHGATRRAVVQALRRVGPVRNAVRKFELARIMHAMEMLTRNGFTVIEAMQLSRAMAQDERLSESMNEALARIEAGQGVSESWHACGVTDSYARGVLVAGERTGNLSACFAALADVYRNDVETYLERLSRIVEPVLLMAVATVIGLIVVLMYMPIFDLATALG